MDSTGNKYYVVFHRNKCDNSYGIYVNSDVLKCLENNEVVVDETGDGFRFREAMINDLDTRKITKLLQRFTYTFKVHRTENMKGKWSLKKEGDWFILDERI